MPANTADSSAADYVVAADYPEPGPASQIMGWHVNGGGEGATLVEDGNMNVGSFEIPPSVPQGTAYTIDSSDTRLTSAVAVTDPAAGQEAVWTQDTIKEGSRSAVRWYELLPGMHTVRQEGTISDPTQFVFNGAISPTREGDAAAIDFNRGSATLHPDLHAESRKAGTPLGQMEGDVTLGSSAGADQDFSCVESPIGVCRWGDYAGASPDPSVGGLVWGSNQGLEAASGPSDEAPRWTTRNFALLAQLDTTIGSGPPSASNDNTPTFTFSANEPSATFECKLDGGGFTACASPFTSPVLGDGSHTFQVRAVEGANVDPTPASRTFAIDTTPPETTIDSGPAGKTTESAPSFGFSSSEAGSTFECSLDGVGFAPCGSPLTTPALADGAHSFQVRATDALGNVDATPVSRSFEVTAARCLKAQHALKKAKKALKKAHTSARKKKAKKALKKAKGQVRKYC